MQGATTVLHCFVKLLALVLSITAAVSAANPYEVAESYIAATSAATATVDAAATGVSEILGQQKYPSRALTEISLRQHDQREQPDHTQQPQKQLLKQDSAFSLLWMTDIHLDHLYDVTASISNFCHAPSEPPLEPRGSFDGSPLYLQARRLMSLYASEESRSHPRRQSLRAAPKESAKATESAAIHPGETDPYLGRAGCDSPPALAIKALQFAASLARLKIPAATATESESYVLPPVAALLLTGDYAAHFADSQVGNRQVLKLESREALKQWTAALLRQFPQTCTGAAASHQELSQQCTQLLLVPGNNDMSADYLVPSARPEWTTFLYELWKPALPADPETKETFMRGLYYKTHLWTVPEIRVLCLNTVLYSVDAKKKLERLRLPAAVRAEAHEVDPAGQFAWMRQQLQEARDLGEQVCLRLSFNSMWIPKLPMYRSLVSDFSDVVISQAFGHIHFGSVRALIPKPESRGPEALTAMLGAPAVSPIHGNNPAIAALVFRQAPTEGVEMGKRRLILSDYVQYSLPLYGFVGMAGRGIHVPEFGFEFSLHQAFFPFMDRMRQLSPAWNQKRKSRDPDGAPPQIDGALAVNIGKAIRTSPMFFALYDWHAAAGGLRISSKVRSCEVLSLIDEELKECLADTEYYVQSSEPEL
ncbi:acid sphingomyelinase-like phosphodiesterase related protein [Cyclospora cayetanensis]|uniref:Acid sphingomyelinase-like phosphodiesterase related protein n=1 Tax=Cyclospora cayetanensis TaxID=88456 RepID=A0A1D3CRX9_9EIME|nr:acid sphingomyelinase-like phosphodiesterase related protein [Cyclospora cayetanensis]